MELKRRDAPIATSECNAMVGEVIDVDRPKPPTSVPGVGRSVIRNAPRVNEAMGSVSNS